MNLSSAGRSLEPPSSVRADSEREEERVTMQGSRLLYCVCTRSASAMRDSSVRPRKPEKVSALRAISMIGTRARASGSQ